MQKIFRQLGAPFHVSIVLCILCILILPISASARIIAVEVVPSNPTVNDNVTIRLSGDFADGCWHPGPGQCGSVDGGVISPSIMVIDVWQPGGICPMVIVDYSFSCEYGTLAAGHYTVNFTEEHESLREPSPEMLSVEFDVTVPPTVEATVDVDPQTLNLRSKGKYITCYVELPAGYDPEDIDVRTVLFDDVVGAVPSPTSIGDHDLDGIPDRMIKFPRSEVIALFEGRDAVRGVGSMDASPGLSAGPSGNLNATISGELMDGTQFVGTDVIKVSN